MCTVRKPSSYDSVRIYNNLLNFTADEDIESFLELLFVDKDKNLFERGIMKLPGTRSNEKIIERNIYLCTFWPT